MTHLIQYGHSAFLGQCDLPEIVSDGESWVLVETSRGREAGRVVSALNAASATLETLRFVRHLGEDEIDADAETREWAEARLAELQSAIESAGLPVQILDAEASWDRARLIFQGITTAACDLSPLFDRVALDHGCEVFWHELSTMPVAVEPAAKGCGKPGCGTESAGGCTSCSTGGGCGTSGCSKGSVASAKDLTTYFSQLRTEMDQQFRRISLHE